LFTESVPSALKEIKGFIEENGIVFSEVGEMILKKKVVDRSTPVVYLCVGCGVMDAAAGRVLLDSLKNDGKKSHVVHNFQNGGVSGFKPRGPILPGYLRQVKSEFS